MPASPTLPNTAYLQVKLPCTLEGTQTAALLRESNIRVTLTVRPLPLIPLAFAGLSPYSPPHPIPVGRQGGHTPRRTQLRHSYNNTNTPLDTSCAPCSPHPPRPRPPARCIPSRARLRTHIYTHTHISSGPAHVHMRCGAVRVARVRGAAGAVRCAGSVRAAPGAGGPGSGGGVRGALPGAHERRVRGAGGAHTQQVHTCRTFHTPHSHGCCTSSPLRTAPEAMRGWLPDVCSRSGGTSEVLLVWDAGPTRPPSHATGGLKPWPTATRLPSPSFPPPLPLPPTLLCAGSGAGGGDAEVGGRVPQPHAPAGGVGEGSIRDDAPVLPGELRAVGRCVCVWGGGAGDRAVLCCAGWAIVLSG